MSAEEEKPGEGVDAADNGVPPEASEDGPDDGMKQEHPDGGPPREEGSPSQHEHQQHPPPPHGEDEDDDDQPRKLCMHVAIAQSLGFCFVGEINDCMEMEFTHIDTLLVYLHT